MISFEEILSWKTSGSFPDDIPPLLQAMLLQAAGDWDSAHRIHRMIPQVMDHGYMPTCTEWKATWGMPPTGTEMQEEASLRSPWTKSGNILQWLWPKKVKQTIDNGNFRTIILTPRPPFQPEYCPGTGSDLCGS